MPTQAGASLVTTLFSDEETHAPALPPCGATRASIRRPAGSTTAWRRPTRTAPRGSPSSARIRRCSPRRIRTRCRAPTGRAPRPTCRRSNMIAGFDINWTIVSAATPAWAKAVFPDDPEEVAVAKLWEAIFAASRVDYADPIAAWDDAQCEPAGAHAPAERQELCGAAFPRPRHRSARRARRRSRMERRLEPRPRTASSATPTSRPRRSSPRRTRTGSTASSRSTKPLSYQGTLIQDIQVRFEGGRIVESKARTGEAVLEQGAGDRRGRAPPRRGGAGAVLLADFAERPAVLQHAVRRERLEPHRARPGLQQVHPRTAAP